MISRCTASLVSVLGVRSRKKMSHFFTPSFILSSVAPPQGVMSWSYQVLMPAALRRLARRRVVSPALPWKWDKKAFRLCGSPECALTVSSKIARAESELPSGGGKSLSTTWGARVGEGVEGEAEEEAPVEEAHEEGEALEDEELPVLDAPALSVLIEVGEVFMRQIVDV